MRIIKALLIVFSGPILMIFLGWYTNWRKLKKGHIQVSFDQFYSIYKNTPSNYWEIEESYNKYYVRYETHKEVTSNFRLYDGMKTIYFKTLLDLIKFRIFLFKYHANEKKILKAKIEQKLNEDTANLVANWNRDIEITRKNNMADLQRMIEENAAKAEEYKRRLEELKNET